MARSSLKEPRSAPRDNREPHTPVHEFTGLLLLAGGLILFLALISYTPADIPDWLPFRNASVKTSSSHSLNYLGITGALIAFAVYSFLGSAAYLLCAVLLGYGSAKLILPGTRLTRRSLWSLAFIVSGACLAHLLDLPLIEARRLALESEGGLIGKWIGGSLMREILGSFGAISALLLVYSLSLLSMTGIHSRDVLQAVLQLPPKILESFQLWLQRRAEERALRQAELEIASDPSLSRPAATPPPRNERRRNPKSPSNELASTVDAAPETTAPQPPETTPASAQKAPLPSPESGPESAPEPVRPAPKIIDGTAPPPKKTKELKREGENLSILENLSCEGYQLPSIDLLDPIDESSRESVDPSELHALQNVIIETLQQFGIEVSPGDITRGPTITRYEVYPAKGVRVDRILALERDLARATRAERINILAPIPGKDTVGIEIANAKKQKVTLRELFESEDFSSNKAKIPIALGKDVYGKTIVADLAAMPHGLVAGTTGSGKSVCINAIIASILYRFTPEQLRFIMIDPKVVEMQMYNTLPHLVVPVVTDPKKVLLALRWAVDEMEKRYAIFAKTGVRNIASFNARPKLKSQKELDAERRARQPELFDESLQPAALPKHDLSPEEDAESSVEAPLPSLADSATESLGVAYEPLPTSAGSNASAAENTNRAAPHSSAEPMPDATTEIPPEPDPETLSAEERIEKMTTIRVPRDTDLRIPERMSYIVIIVDELADLMQTAPADVEGAIARITQKARAAGIHMIIATQTPRADVITGVIKANVPCRVAFQVASALDSRVILDENGAEKLLGQGDMLYRPPGTSRMVRAQGVLVTDDEVRRLVEFASAQGDPQFENSIQSRLQGEGDGDSEEVSDEDEDLVDKCIEVMRQEKKASTSLFQRRLRLGYTRAARILDILESRGYVGQGEGAKPREILVDLDTL